MTIVCLYVDDLLCTSQEKDGVIKVFNELNELKIKNLGSVTKFLGICVERTSMGYLLSQRNNINELINDCDLEEAKSVKTSIDDSYQDEMARNGELLDQDESTAGKMRVKKFRSVVGSLLWLCR